MWIGPSGATARGGAALLADAAAVLSISPGSHIGPATPVRLDRPGDAATSSIRPLGEHRYNAKDAAAAHAVDRVDNVLGDLIVGLDNQTVITAHGTKVLSTAEVIGEGNGRRRRPNQDVRFRASVSMVSCCTRSVTRGSRTCSSWPASP